MFYNSVKRDGKCAWYIMHATFPTLARPKRKRSSWPLHWNSTQRSICCGLCLFEFCIDRNVLDTPPTLLTEQLNSTGADEELLNHHIGYLPNKQYCPNKTCQGLPHQLQFHKFTNLILNHTSRINTLVSRIIGKNKIRVTRFFANKTFRQSDDSVSWNFQQKADSGS